jgi:hypothetical protein
MLRGMYMQINKRRYNHPLSQILYRKRRKPGRHLPLQGKKLPRLDDGDSVFSYPEFVGCGRIDKMAFV